VSNAVDVYADQFAVHIGPYGCVLNYSLSSAVPPSPGGAPQADRVATVRMSLEHLKVMAYILRRQLLDYERQAGVRVQVPGEVLNALRIGAEDWNTVWGRADRGEAS
jgi:hypothetical protein